MPNLIQIWNTRSHLTGNRDNTYCSILKFQSDLGKWTKYGIKNYKSSNRLDLYGVRTGTAFRYCWIFSFTLNLDSAIFSNNFLGLGKKLKSNNILILLQYMINFLLLMKSRQGNIEIVETAVIYGSFRWLFKDDLSSSFVLYCIFSAPLLSTAKRFFIFTHQFKIICLIFLPVPKSSKSFSSMS